MCFGPSQTFHLSCGGWVSVSNVRSCFSHASVVYENRSLTSLRLLHDSMTTRLPVLYRHRIATVLFRRGRQRSLHPPSPCFTPTHCSSLDVTASFSLALWSHFNPYSITSNTNVFNPGLSSRNCTNTRFVLLCIANAHCRTGSGSLSNAQCTLLQA